jgi:DNA topoisomerase I
MELKEAGVAADLSHRELVQLNHDYEEAARIARLRYVSDSSPGITRVRKGTGFAYYRASQKISDKAELQRIRSLVIPPAWTNVWICPYENGHIQATGYDVKKRKQYKYHALWSAVRNETKFHRLFEFGKALPQLRAVVEKDLMRKDLSQERVLATIVSLMERTYIRVGSEDYEKLYGSYGITTLKNNHVKVQGDTIAFSFIGKKGIAQSVSIKSKRLARIVQQCREIPGKELFQYYDAQGNRNPIDSGKVNDYIRNGTKGDFSAKDIRTWAGSLSLLRSLRALGEAVTVTECRRNIVAALDEVSEKLGNTRAVCRKYYVHPGLITLYEQNNLSRYLEELDDVEQPDLATGLTSDEKVLMRILKRLN